MKNNTVYLASLFVVISFLFSACQVTVRLRPPIIGSSNSIITITNSLPAGYLARIYAGYCLDRKTKEPTASVSLASGGVAQIPLGLTLQTDVGCVVTALIYVQSGSELRYVGAASTSFSVNTQYTQNHFWNIDGFSHARLRNPITVASVEVEAGSVYLKKNPVRLGGLAGSSYFHLVNNSPFFVKVVYGRGSSFFFNPGELALLSIDSPVNEVLIFQFYESPSLTGFYKSLTYNTYGHSTGVYGYSYVLAP